MYNVPFLCLSSTVNLHHEKAGNGEQMIRRDFLRNTSVGLASAWFPNAGTAQTHPSSGMNRPTASGVFDVRSYGASGDGKTIDSPAINRAIEAAAAHGGG